VLQDIPLHPQLGVLAAQPGPAPVIIGAQPFRLTLSVLSFFTQSQGLLAHFGSLATTPRRSDSATGMLCDVIGELSNTTSNRGSRRTGGSVHGADSTTAPRSRLGPQRRTTIAFNQPGQQIPQAPASPGKHRHPCCSQ